MNKTGVQLAVLILIALLCLLAFGEESWAIQKANPAQSQQAKQSKSNQRSPAQKAVATSGDHKAKPQPKPGPEALGDGSGNHSQDDSGISAPEHDHSSINQQLAATIKTSDPINYLNDTKALVALALLISLALGLHIAQMLLQMQTRQKVIGLQSRLQRLSDIWANAESRPGNNNAAGDFTEQLNRQKQEYQQISAQLELIDKSLVENSNRITETLDAVAVTIQWIGQSRIDEVIKQTGDQASEVDLAQNIKILGRYKEVFKFNAERVRPLCEALRSFIEGLRTRPSLPAELTGRAQSLHRDIQQIDGWHTELSERLDSLQRGSLADRLAMMRAHHGKLAQRIYSGTLSIADYVRDYQDSFESYLPKDAEDSSIKLSPAECESQLKRMLTGMSDYLMNWFDDLFQLQSQVMAAQTSGSQVDAQTAVGFASIQTIAREVLGKFDVQPEEIQIGQTFYDRRLHDAELVAQSAQFPANTVIGINQCGFRKISTGEVLRRPRVIVAGVGAI